MELPLRPQKQGIQQPSNQTEVNYQPKHFNVGVDFGSTYSAATLALISASTPRLPACKIKNITYPVATSHNRHNCCEVPTVLRYEDLCTRWGWDAKRVEDSAGAPPGKFVDMIKLLLDDAEYTDETDQAGRDNLRRRVAEDIKVLNKSVVDILVDYLTPFFKHIMDYMIEQGYYDPRDTVELDCTVPAIWKEKSRRKMLAAIGQAGEKSGFGFGKAVWLVSEPEAGSSYILEMNPHWDLQIGENVLLCDAGGGTVDLITYTVTQNGPLRVEEAVGGTGGLCGSNYTNSRCLEQTLQRLKLAKFVDGKKSPQMLLKLAKDVTNDFDRLIKPTFMGKGDIDHKVTVPRLMASPDDEFTDDKMIFTPDRLNLIFDPVISQVWHLMRSQLESARLVNLVVQKVCLVGGFGGSPRLQSYLRDMLRGWAAAHDLDPIDLFVPDAPGNAVAYGATKRSMDKTNGAPRICRSSLGIAMTELYDKSSASHKNAKVVPDKYDGKKYVRDCLDWMFELGETLPPTKIPRQRALHRDVPVDKDSLTLSVTVYSSDTNRQSHYPVTHLKNDDCEVLEEVDFTLDMTKFRDKLERYRKPRTRGPARKHRQGLSGPQRKSDRKRFPTVKSPEYQCHSHSSGSVDEEGFTSQTSSPDVFSLATASSSETLGSSHDQQSSSFAEPHEQEASSPTPDDDSTPEEYYRVHYNFVIEVDGLIIKYRMEIPDANESVEGEVALANILSPGSS